MILLHTDIEKIPDIAKGCVLVIGNFDGVHKGHRALIKEAQKLAKELNAPLGVMTFEPHPRQFFKPDAKAFRLTTVFTKKALLEDLGVEHLFAFPFNKDFSEITAEKFVDDILVNKLKAKHVIVGEGFSFGHKRSGSTNTLEEAQKAQKFGFTAMPIVKTDDNIVYSSSNIRELLRAGKLTEANKLLGWTWEIASPVVHGDKRGRELGFPTANQEMGDYISIPYGVYAVKVQIEGETDWHYGAANFGTRPMFKLIQPIFETFIFDFSKEIYGKKLRVQPIAYLRPELSFDGLDALKTQMKEDCIKAKGILKSSP